MNKPNEDFIRYYDNSSAKYVVIDRQTGFSCYQSVDQSMDQSMDQSIDKSVNTFQKEKQNLSSNSEKSEKNNKTINKSIDKRLEDKQRLRNINEDIKGLDGCLRQHSSDTNEDTGVDTNSLGPEFGLTSDMKINESIKLDKYLISNGSLRVIGQLDLKFIVCLAIDRNLLLAFDQHAVHERIRYETLLKQIFDSNKEIKTIPVLPPIAIQLNSIELKSSFKWFVRQVKSLVGIELMRHQKKNKTKDITETENNRYFVKQIPECLSDSLDFESMKDIIEEAVIVINQRTNGSNDWTGNRLTPKLLERLQTKACRGAIRFGDVLKLHDCLKLINSLSECNVCFRCAHGRPSVAPLAYLPKHSD